MGEDDKREEEKSFVVRDRRFTAQKETVEEPKPEKEGEKREEPLREDVKREPPLPEISFANFLLSLSTSALIQLGEIPDPLTKQAAIQLPLAKQTIDLIAMLQGKTKGNLTPEEEKLMEHILYDLRMRYVIAAG
ncbi:MAG: DUF1844 domain-containing protein [Deltaproteobacteria bacterium]|nr:MAG: DUF1844 domain-containing protein [Deltaproteobacteria bacterium]